MKNKKLLYVLLPLAALVWGTVIYKMMQSLEAPQVKVSEGVAAAQPVNNKLEADTFQLQLSYRDPFLSARSRKEEIAVVPSLPHFIQPVAASPSGVTAPVQAVKEPKAVIVWPQVAYKGIIENKVKSARVAILRVGQESLLLKEGEGHEGLKLNKLLADSVLMEYKKEKKYLKRL